MPTPDRKVKKGKAMGRTIRTHEDAIVTAIKLIFDTAKPAELDKALHDFIGGELAAFFREVANDLVERVFREREPDTDTYYSSDFVDSPEDATDY